MNDIFVGCALSDVNRADVPTGLRVPERLADYARRFRERVGAADFCFELQPEDAWTLPAAFPDRFVERKTNRWWRAFRQNTAQLDLFRSSSAPVGVHQPIQGRNVLSSNYFLKYEAIAETHQAMALAEFIGASYFVFHLAMADAWDWDRRDQLAKALKIFRAFEAFYHASSFSFVPCIELLEYPKFPATGGEALEILLRCREIWPETRLIFDVSHLWSSRRRMMAAGRWESRDGRPVGFLDTLEYALEQTWNDIYLFHLGGCWESETHAVPGLHPQQDPFRYEMKLRESAGVYAEAGEMDLNRALDLVLHYTVRKEIPLRLMLQIFDRDVDQVFEAARVIRAELLARAADQPRAIESPKKPRARKSVDGRSRPRQRKAKPAAG
ncbi:MAG: hypothetical protein HY782_27635 [Chloroflexi bacterium]|nr:hypothetical protein [Chloroflexota bacterium]